MFIGYKRIDDAVWTLSPSSTLYWISITLYMDKKSDHEPFIWSLLNHAQYILQIYFFFFCGFPFNTLDAFWSLFEHRTWNINTKQYLLSCHVLWLKVFEIDIFVYAYGKEDGFWCETKDVTMLCTRTGGESDTSLAETMFIWELFTVFYRKKKKHIHSKRNSFLGNHFPEEKKKQNFLITRKVDTAEMFFSQRFVCLT